MRGSPRSTTRRDGERGQTSIDFVVGIGVFLLVVGSVAGFVPDLFAPFDDDPQRPLVTDRAADRVVGHLTDVDGNPGVLNTSCTLAFLRQNAAVCGFDPQNDLTEQIGIGTRYRANVSLRRNTTAAPGLEILCTDGDEPVACSAGGPKLAAGPPVPGNRSSVDSARRVVHVAGRDATVVIHVW